MVERFWLVSWVDCFEKACELYRDYKRKRVRVFMFKNVFDYGYLVAAYASEEVHAEICGKYADNIVESYVGEERLQECFTYHVIIG